MSQILGVKFNDFGQIYYFSSGPFVVREGHSVIVKTEQGMGLGKVFVVQQDLPEDVSEDSIKTIYRLAGEEDLEAEVENKELSRTAYRFCKNCIDRQKLEMKLVDVEVFFDRSKMIFYFTAPGRIDFRELVKDLVKEYRTRIELRQIGVRHETQMLGAIGNCGQICCCRRFMRKFMPVTIRMAKEQNLFLNPTKISGICGRLLCCLSFEQENYEDFHRKSPKTGKKYNTVHGTVRVTRTNFFRNTLTVLPEQGDEIEIPLDDWPDMIKPSGSDRGGESDFRSDEPRRGRSEGRGDRDGNSSRPQRSRSDRSRPDRSRSDRSNSDRPRPERKPGRVNPEREKTDQPKVSVDKPEVKEERRKDDSQQQDRRKRPVRKDRPQQKPEQQKPEQDKQPATPAPSGEKDDSDKPKKSSRRRPARRRRKRKPSGQRKNKSN
ncbi:PSP1 domain-containing protein [Maridesulfovibrio salexigens]|uniref:PSP1 domain protein n=1 Tax=Maridesulfovibrio salexigens (strain ATCC 14822 / DSM 2638 / NCIMB 8403 / VKM B-1763) TaxID=526222 RepID=C6BW32_MARSD|nr:regulatory iron-sulfur-containing complex subunit RicT [Maridesulfovibrio salexigens]ACS80235.1 PSP1 domain protein [Maridesulfovibrio salexigens DSM 2638]